MIGKLCAPPKGGGSAGGLVEYLVGYAVAAKGASKEEIQDALASVYLESENREDLGIGRIWSPVAGGGTRPSSILARNCASFQTASLEMDSDALGNPGVRSGAMHYVWSFSESETKRLSDEQVHAYVGEVLKRMGLDHHRSVEVVHRDTENIHVHVAVGSVDPNTGLAYDRTGLYKRMAWAEREVELAHKLEHDRGLAVVRDAGTSMARVDWADKHELAAWRAERKEERLLRLERRSWTGYRERDVTFHRFSDATIAPRLQMAIDAMAERDRKADWATLHAVAARYGAALQTDTEGRVILRDVGIGEIKLQHQAEQNDLKKSLKERGIEKEEIDQHLASLKAEHGKSEVVERARKQVEGETVVLEGVLEGASDLPSFLTVAEAELDIIAAVEANPQLVVAEVTAQSSTFSREDIDLWLCSRISDPTAIERLGDLVLQDDSIRILSADTVQPLMTTTAILEVEDRLAQDTEALAQTQSGISVAQIDTAIAAYEGEQRAKTGKPFHINGGQKNALYGLSRGSLVDTEGLPGTGKTTIQGVIRVLGEQTSRDTCGVSLAQIAAERLAVEAGFRTVNTARAKILEGLGEEIVPRDGILSIEEGSMLDSKTMQILLAAARERGTIVNIIHDDRQLAPIDFGQASRIVKDAAKRNGTYSELREIQRQQRGWHKEAVVLLSDAIIEKDEARRLTLVKQALKSLDDQGAITWVGTRDEAIDKAVTLARMHKAMGYTDTLMPAVDRDTVRHLSEEDRRRDGLEGNGLKFLTNGGTREVAVGDVLAFGENSLGRRGLGVCNGDRGEVVEVHRDRISVRMFSTSTQPSARTITFSPRGYKNWEIGRATTHARTQGASVDASVPVIDRAASAELVFMAVSRSKHALDMVVATSVFKDLNELAEHVSNRIGIKTTTRTYDEALEKTGGKETMRVQNIEAQREAINSPLRVIYESDVSEPSKLIRRQAVDKVREAYAERKRDISADSRLTLAERLSAENAALAQMRSKIAAIYKEMKAQPYSAWLKEREIAHGRTREIAYERDGQRRAAQARDVKHNNENADDRHRYSEREIGYAYER